MSEMQQQSGYIAIIGRPNVGKSTLLNKLLQQKISITSRKPQTTRHQILGVLTESNKQAIFVDTPGIHRGHKKALNRYMNRAARNALQGVDLVLLLVDAAYFSDEDEWILEGLEHVTAPIALVINKIDNVKDKRKLLPYLEKLSKKFNFQNIVPLSAKTGDNLEQLKKIVFQALPEGRHMFSADTVTDKSERFLATEIVREKLVRHLGDELPHSLGVTLEDFKREEKLIRLIMIIWVERKSQKQIVVGKDGDVLKKVGTLARKEMEQMFDCKVYLNLWVKVKEGWTDNKQDLQQFGFE